MNISNLNLNSLQTIYNFLPSKDLAHIRQVSKGNKQIIDTTLTLNNKIKKAAKETHINLLDSLKTIIEEMEEEMETLYNRGYEMHNISKEKLLHFRRYSTKEANTARKLLIDIQHKMILINREHIRLLAKFRKLEEKDPIAACELKIYSLFGKCGKKKFEKLPVLELKSIDLGKIYLEEDGIQPDQMTHPIMRGTDTCGRLFFAVKAHGRDDQFHVQTFFPRKVEEARWSSIGYKHVNHFSLYIGKADSATQHNKLVKTFEGLYQLEEFIKPLIKDL